MYNIYFCLYRKMWLGSNLDINIRVFYIEYYYKIKLYIYLIEIFFELIWFLYFLLLINL